MEFGSTVALLFASSAVPTANSALPDADIAHVIQLAVAPVFLLSGVGVMLTVFTSRLARIVDRSRVLEERLQSAAPPGPPSIFPELDVLSRRARIIDIAIALTTLTGLFVCIVIAALFVSLTSLQLTRMVSAIFVLAMLAFAIAFMLFLVEVLIGTAHLSGSRASLRRKAAPTQRAPGHEIKGI
jgi:hypothetical protein